MTSLVNIKHFALATRESGYKNTSSALAELIDNAFEANATRIRIEVVKTESDKIISVADNGCGMTQDVMRDALRFGGTTRFNSRSGTGRFGMGLPNSSLSQARRIDVFSKTIHGRMSHAYLDLDEILKNGNLEIAPRFCEQNEILGQKLGAHGTIVHWTKCDKLELRNLANFNTGLAFDLGRIFREQLWQGKMIAINGESVRPVDPLFLRAGKGMAGAISYGPPLRFDVKANNNAKGCISVRFVELPIEQWYDLSNEDKSYFGISKGGGITIMRAGREITTGWFFMGSKRKENYDDWWRCEISFDPILDELFGVTHTKQDIRPTAVLVELLTPDVERIGRVLNNRVRERYLKIKERDKLISTHAKRIAEERDYLCNPIPDEKPSIASRTSGISYHIELSPLREAVFFSFSSDGGKLVIKLNEDHPFFQSLYKPLCDPANPNLKELRSKLELLILAAARSEIELADGSARNEASSYRKRWSNVLAAFLS